MDAQASYGFGLHARRVTLFADVFNLFNQRRTLDYDNWTEISLGVPKSGLLAQP